MSALIRALCGRKPTFFVSSWHAAIDLLLRFTSLCAFYGKCRSAILSGVMRCQSCSPFVPSSQSTLTP